MTFLLNKQNLIFSRLVVTPVGPQSLEKKSPLFKNPEIIESEAKIRIRKIFFVNFFSDSFASIFRETNLSQN